MLITFSSYINCPKCRALQQSLQQDLILSGTNRGNSYEARLGQFQNIKLSAILIVCSHSVALTNTQLNDILLAMLEKKHIILPGLIGFDQQTGLFPRAIIKDRLSKILLFDIFQLDAADLGTFLNNLRGGTISYSLTLHERTLIKSRLRAELRTLLTA